MKKLYTAFCFIALATVANAQSGSNSYYQYGYSPMAQLGTSHGFGIDMFGKLKKSNFSVGISYSAGIYGYKETPLEVITADGAVLNTTVNVTNSFQQVSFYQRYNLGQFSKVLFPFVDTRLGWNFFRTKLFVADPEDTDECKPLEQAVLQRDNNWAAYGGAGVDIKLTSGCNCSICAKKDENTGLFFNFSVGYAFGGRVSYMNVDADELTSSAPHSGSHQHDEEGNTLKSAYFMPFINTQTQVVHQHHVGYVYTSPVRMIQIKAGFTFKF